MKAEDVIDAVVRDSNQYERMEGISRRLINDLYRAGYVIQSRWAERTPGCVYCDAGHPPEWDGRITVHDGGRGQSPCPSFK